jgi:putative ABC transport system substrate-binding protein
MTERSQPNYRLERTGSTPAAQPGCSTHSRKVLARGGGDQVRTRRAFLGTLAGGLLAALAVDAQPTAKVYRLGLLGGSSPKTPGGRRAWEGFFQGMQELGYVEGQNILVEGRWYGERTDRLPSLAAELVRLNVDVIVTGTAPAPEAAQRATSAIPIVMAIHSDPVGSGLAVSLAKPGKNVTGLSTLAPELVGKRLQLLKEAVPRISRLAVLWNPTVTTQALELSKVESATRSLQMQLQVLEARTSGDFAGAFSAMTKVRVGGVIILASAMFYAERERIAELAAQNRVPAIYGSREFAEAGGLMAYGIDLRESFRGAATYVDKILKGAEPADLPVEQPTKFELLINLKTAKALGLKLPQQLLSRADEVIR